MCREKPQRIMYEKLQTSVPEGRYSRCKTTTKPIIPSIAVFIHGCSESMIVTYPTKGMYPTESRRD